MKKIGLLFGQETNFPLALIERINQQKIRGISAEAVLIDKVMQGTGSGYTVVLDRISHHVPFLPLLAETCRAEWDRRAQ